MSLLRKLQIFSSSVAKLWNIDNANTARTTSTVVGAVQEIDSTGKVSPAGDTLANAPFSKGTIYDSNGDELFIDERPANVVNTDNVGRKQANTVFGEGTIGIRTPSISNQFMYGADFRKTKDELVGAGSLGITDDSLAFGSTGAQTNSSAVLETKNTVRYAPGYESYLLITIVFDTPKAGSIQEVGLYEEMNGFWLGYNTSAEFGFMRLRAGVEHWIPIDEWDVDVVTGVNKYGFILDQQLGNLYKISYGYLGYAPISLEIMTEEGYWLPVIKIKYPNTEQSTHIANTYLPIRGKVANTTNDTDVQFKIGSVCAGIVDGSGKYVSSRKFGLIIPVTATGTNTVVVLIRNKQQFYSKMNYVAFLLERLSFSSDGAQSVTIELIRNATISNTPTWTDRDTINSIFEYSVDATITAGTGEELIGFELSKVDSLIEKLDYLDFEIFPGDTITILVNGNNNVKTSLNWSELF